MLDVLRSAGCDAVSPFCERTRDAILRALFQSRSSLALLPIQDIFGWRDRINVPALISDVNWCWRLPWPVEDLLKELSRLEFLYERVVGDGTVYVFRHVLSQETAYGSLLERHRRMHHGTVGYALEQLYRDRNDEVAELLAFHFGRSDDVEKAVDYAILAAEKAQRHWANSDALTFFGDALHRLDRLPDTEANRLRRIDAVLKQSEVEYALGQYTEHLQTLEKIRSIVDETGDPRRRAGWHYWTGFLHSVSGGRPEVAIEIRGCDA